MCFDYNGGFLGNIGHLGQGPFEYTYINRLAYDPLSKQLLVQPSGKMQFYLFDEATLGVFNISGTDSVKFLLFCPDETYTTVLNTTSPIIPIICNYTKFKFAIDYSTNAGETYYRTFILSPDEALEVDIYLIDMILLMEGVFEMIIGQ